VARLNRGLATCWGGDGEGDARELKLASMVIARKKLSNGGKGISERPSTVSSVWALGQKVGDDWGGRKNSPVTPENISMGRKRREKRH